MKTAALTNQRVAKQKQAPLTADAAVQPAATTRRVPRLERQLLGLGRRAQLETPKALQRECVSTKRHSCPFRADFRK